MKAAEAQLCHEEAGQLLFVARPGQPAVAVRPVWLAPFSRPDRFLALVDADDVEVAVIEDPGALPPASLEAVRRELHRLNLARTITRVLRVREEEEYLYWTVEAGGARQEFITRELDEACRQGPGPRLLLTDVEGSRFEIPDPRRLDRASRAWVTKALR